MDQLLEGSLDVLLDGAGPVVGVWCWREVIGRLSLDRGVVRLGRRLAGVQKSYFGGSLFV